VDFTRFQVEGNAFERANRAEGFGHVRELEERFQTANQR
jgi:hypothetical protein